ncbi:hypothetical protein HOG98_03805 [bacterium]|nr:hypothetical protein [bacterium]
MTSIINSGSGTTAVTSNTQEPKNTAVTTATTAMGIQLKPSSPSVTNDVRGALSSAPLPEIENAADFTPVTSGNGSQSTNVANQEPTNKAIKVKANRTVGGDTNKLLADNLKVLQDALENLKDSPGVKGNKEKTDKLDTKIKQVKREIIDLRDEDSEGPSEPTGKIKHFFEENGLSKKNVGNIVGQLDDIRTELGLKSAKELKPSRFSRLKSTFTGKKYINKDVSKKLIHNSTLTVLNKGPWKQKVSNFQRKHFENVTSTITPANTNGNTETGISNSIFADRAETGLTCQGNLAETGKSGNCQMTNLSKIKNDIKKTLYSGIRHAIVATKDASPSNVKLDAGLAIAIGSQSGTSIENLTIDQLNKLAKTLLSGDSPSMKLRLDSFKEAIKTSDGLETAKKGLAKLVSNRNKAKDLVRSAIMQKLNNMSDDALDNLKKERSLDLNLTSVSLVTPSKIDELRNGGYHEKAMLAEQTEALKFLETLSPAEKTELLSEFKSGGKHIFGEGAKLSVKANTFNFGVNELERMGRSEQATQNKEAKDSLLASTETKLTELNDQIGNAKDGSTTKSDLEIQKLKLEMVRDKFIKGFEELSNSGESYFMGSSQVDPYNMPKLAIALSQLTDGIPLSNCKSGKDRTSQADVGVKILLNDLDDATTKEEITAALDKSKNMIDSQTILDANAFLEKPRPSIKMR